MPFGVCGFALDRGENGKFLGPSPGRWTNPFGVVAARRSKAFGSGSSLKTR